MDKIIIFPEIAIQAISPQMIVFYIKKEFWDNNIGWTKNKAD